MQKIKQIINSFDRQFDDRPIFLQENYEAKHIGTEGSDVFQFSASIPSLFIKAKEGQNNLRTMDLSYKYLTNHFSSQIV